MTCLPRSATADSRGIDCVPLALAARTHARHPSLVAWEDVGAFRVQILLMRCSYSLALNVNSPLRHLAALAVAALRTLLRPA